MTITVGVVVFPGSNCEQDAVDAVRTIMQCDAKRLWHNDTDVTGVDAIIIPGGFSYGDYLRSGALARFSPIIQSIRAFAEAGKPVIGICNGFQILTEARLLPGMLQRNTSLRFQCDHAPLTVANTRTPFTQGFTHGQSLTLPIAHAEGNYTAPPEVLEQLEANGQVVFRYGREVNGSANRIAGICNAQGNVVGMMPHPERNIRQTPLWNGEGATVFTSLLQSLLQNTATPVACGMA